MTGAIVVMGVSGSGKSTLGNALAAVLGCPFVEGDTLHPASNIAKMAAGVPLDDADRQPYLERVAQICAEQGSSGVVISCSALKRRYRDLIRSRAPAVTFVLPMLNQKELLQRVTHRPSHFMPASLLESQLGVLEIPERDEHVILVDGALPTGDQIAYTVAAMKPGRTCMTSSGTAAGPKLD